MHVCAMRAASLCMFVCAIYMQVHVCRWPCTCAGCTCTCAHMCQVLLEALHSCIGLSSWSQDLQRLPRLKALQGPPTLSPLQLPRPQAGPRASGRMCFQKGLSPQGLQGLYSVSLWMFDAFRKV